MDWSVLLGAYIAGLTVYTATFVGKVPSGPCNAPYTWELPMTMAAIVLIPAILGWFVGRHE